MTYSQMCGNRAYHTILNNTNHSKRKLRAPRTTLVRKACGEMSTLRFDLFGPFRLTLDI